MLKRNQNFLERLSWSGSLSWMCWVGFSGLTLLGGVCWVGFVGLGLLGLFLWIKIAGWCLDGWVC